ncbi:siderophore ABC transporter substrate-binding protein [Oceanobacillus sp. J11TS1]|uniref:siderophore ABC transporter substrate-binding protein n=1 Tax=Oceanobacillus sp. J11TS1 TaxID=2807191 RepID=UPI001B2398FF|nr:siderophore ABC transporter substrate-binding protein [Oceanobacillus sp. J11TS1]GIO24547.1 putative ABC transporter solute-binding protein YclQ [Oceanobacillus sp. J11TS1]
MKKSLLFIMLTSFLLLMAACGSDSNDNAGESDKSEGETPKEETVTITHELGETEVPVNPEKVVVFDFGILDTLDKLDIPVTGVAKSGSIPSYLEKYESDEYENIGGLKEPDFEKIAEIAPDLIIISGRQADMYEEFQKLAPTVHLGVDTTRYMESFEENMHKVGQIFDVDDQVETELQTIEDNIAELNEKAADAGDALIILANDDKISAYGQNSRFGIIHDVFGVSAVDEDIEASTHGMNVSFEYVMEQNPDMLYVVDRGAAIATDGETNTADLVENDLVANTEAYKNDQIYYLNPDVWYLSGGGLTSVQKMIDEIDASLE